MSDEPEEEELGEAEMDVTPPDGVILGDGEVAIFDKEIFAAETNSLAVMVREYCLFILDADSHEWRKLEDKKKARLASVKKEQGQ